MSDLLVDRLDRLRSEAAALAADLGARARRSTTIGSERALLRLLGVGGLSHGGRPLAGAVVERTLGDDRARLARGVLLPFAAAVEARASTPLELAHEIADGRLDLAAYAAELEDPLRRRAAEEAAARLMASAAARIDANRTARFELVGLLGEPPDPQVGTTLEAFGLDEVRGRARDLIAVGADVLRVPVPASRELVERLHDLGERSPASPLDRDALPRAPVVRAHPPSQREALARLVGLVQDPPEAQQADRAERRRSARDRHARRAAGASAAGASSAARGPEVIPAGSQRGLAVLRATVDEAAAASSRSRYPRLATVSPALGAPEQAVVAAFERIDLVESDPITEIVGAGIDPDRALADHAFARRLHLRAGTTLLQGAGPLVVGPDLIRGVPSDRATRAGRALALQALGVAFALADGFPPQRLVVGVLPAWIAGEPDGATQALAAVTLRRLAYPRHALAFDEPQPEQDGADSAAWQLILAASLPFAGTTRLVLRRASGDAFDRTLVWTRAASRIADEVAASCPSSASITGPALEHALASVEIAVQTLAQLRGEGWRAVLGDPLLVHGGSALGGEGVVEVTPGDGASVGPVGPVGFDRSFGPPVG